MDRQIVVNSSFGSVYVCQTKYQQEGAIAGVYLNESTPLIQVLAGSGALRAAGSLVFPISASMAATVALSAIGARALPISAYIAASTSLMVVGFCVLTSARMAASASLLAVPTSTLKATGALLVADTSFYPSFSKATLAAYLRADIESSIAVYANTISLEVVTLRASAAFAAEAYRIFTHFTDRIPVKIVGVGSLTQRH